MVQNNRELVPSFGLINSLVITGSTVIFAPNSSYPLGVIGFDFQLWSIYNLSKYI